MAKRDGSAAALPGSRCWSVLLLTRATWSIYVLQELRGVFLVISQPAKMAERQCVLKSVNFGAQNIFCRQCVNFMPPASLALISRSACGHILDKTSIFYNVFSERIVLLSSKILNPFWVASWMVWLWIMAMLWWEFQNNSFGICHQNSFPVLVDDITWVETQLLPGMLCHQLMLMKHIQALQVRIYCQM